MKFPAIAGRALAASLTLLTGSAVLHAQDAASSAPRTPNRIVTAPSDTHVSRRVGDTLMYARPEFDRGALPASFALNRMRMILKRTDEQESALERFMEQQQDPHSLNFQHWLEPEAFGELYGPSDADMAVLVAWLRSHGFSVDEVTKGRTSIGFSGTAAQVRQAFHTEMHQYVRGKEKFYANNADPSIPEALTPVVRGIGMLNNFPAKMLRQHRTVHRDAQTGKWKAQLNDGGQFVAPQNSAQFQIQGVGPQDFATIYNVQKLWNVGITGKNITIAIAAGSDVNPDDVTAFQTFFNLPTTGSFVTTNNGTDPGYTDSQSENSLDVEWSGAMAPGATVNLVVTSSANGDFVSSAQYVVDNKIAPILNVSYGVCELALGSTNNAMWNTLWQQAAAEGISVFVSAGDSAAAFCDSHDQTPPAYAIEGLEVNGVASTPYNTAVGGTDFDWNNLGQFKYWSKTNSANNSSALGYIPEVPWNGSCASPDVDTAYAFEYALTGLTPIQACQFSIYADVTQNLVNVLGGSGGVSACTTPTGTNPGSCAGGYAKPSWQTGLGVPVDGHRDIPDVSLFASGGILGSALLYCDSSSTPCDYTNSDDIVVQSSGGTSFASPAMAGIMALVLQQVGKAQGNAAPTLYKLAARDNRASCNSLTVAATGSTCIFYDITTDNNAVPCTPKSINCVYPTAIDTNTPGVGILSGYASTAGYDLATGLGSVNVYNLVTNWKSAQSKAADSTALALQADFFGEGKEQYTVWRSATGEWYSLDAAGKSTATQFGVSSDAPVLGDFDGDGKTDISVFRPSTGTWYSILSSTGQTQSTVFGASTDLPVRGDFDGDGKSDIAVWRPSTGYWYVLQSSNGEVVAHQFGASTDVPVAGDFDGDGKTDIAVFRPSTGYWYIIQSSNGEVVAHQWGDSTDIPVSGDFDGDGKTDIAVFRPSTGYWYIVQSSNGEVVAYPWGDSTDIPVSGDFDGDGKTDIAVFRPSTGYWYVVQSSNGEIVSQPFGVSTDDPVNKMPLP